jgi:hypothetical protein
MKNLFFAISCIALTVVMMVSLVAAVAPPSTKRNSNVPTRYAIEIPEGYRDWPFISIARVGTPVNDMRVKLGNPVAIHAYREGKLPFPDGAIIARLAYRQATSEENNNAFRGPAEKQLGPEGAQKLLSESFVAGDLTNVQFMIKDSKKYASTGGWGFFQFTNGKQDGEEVHKTCFSCHSPAKDRDFVFTRYSQ